MPEILPNETARYRALAMSVVLTFADPETTFGVDGDRWAMALASLIVQMSGGGVGESDDLPTGPFSMQVAVFDALVFRGVGRAEAQRALSGDDAAAGRVREELQAGLPRTPRDKEMVIAEFARAA